MRQGFQDFVNERKYRQRCAHGLRMLAKKRGRRQHGIHRPPSYQAHLWVGERRFPWGVPTAGENLTYDFVNRGLR